VNIKEIAIIVAVLAFGYYLGTNDVLARFIPGSS
jgi:hypothetical protein